MSPNGSDTRTTPTGVRGTPAGVVVRVGLVRFELTTPCSQSRCATKLRHSPPERGRYPGRSPTLTAFVSQSTDTFDTCDPKSPTTSWAR